MSLLKPCANRFRQHLDLSGLWEWRADPSDRGRGEGWARGFDQGVLIAVPASWNEQVSGMRDFLGPAWYQTSFELPWGWDDKTVQLRFGSVNYAAEAWLNGERVGSHEGGHLPFVFDVGDGLLAGRNELVVRVDGRAAPEHVPPGGLQPGGETFPTVVFDFFPYCGIHRPVLLCATPPTAIRGVAVVTTLDGPTARVTIRVDTRGENSTAARVSLSGHGDPVSRAFEIVDASGAAELEVAEPELWAPGSPALYDLAIELLSEGEPIDRYEMKVGLRTVAVEGEQLLLNGEPVFLRGFGRHEDFPVAGRGLVPAVAVKDLELLRWMGANSFRTTHYPYAEETMDLADREGILVIDEIPAFGLDFGRDTGESENWERMCRQFVGNMIERDRNHPSVIMWSLANEPMAAGDRAQRFFRELRDLAHRLDDTRPATVVSPFATWTETLESADVLDLCDVICLNRYFGWYEKPGRPGEAVEMLLADLDAIHERHAKPIMVTEFGADAISGCHADPPEMFSEEYQAELLTAYLEALDSRPFVVGAHVWTLCDFKAVQTVLRAGSLSQKGVFTRDRRPKLAAHRLRELWSSGGVQRRAD